jgi:hypothetical protein
MGALCALIAWLGHSKGEILTGVKFNPGRKANREDNPRSFYFFLTQWMILAGAFVTWGIAILLGFVQPMPW